MSAKVMSFDAYLAPDSAISADDLENLTKYVDQGTPEEDAYATALGLAKRLGLTDEVQTIIDGSGTYASKIDDIITTLQTSEQLTKIDEPVSI